MHDSILKNLSVTFDLDGTLVDTAPDLVRVLNEVIAPDGLEPVAVEDARTLIGFGSMAMIRKAYENAHVPLSDPNAVSIQRKFLDLYAEDLSQVSTAYPGVETVLALLKRAGARLSVCTNKPGDMARPLLEQLGLAQYFDRIVGSGDSVATKPAAEHIFAAVGHRGVRRHGGLKEGASPIVMIGDGAPDVFAARAAKVPVILMAYGYSPISVHTFGADAVLRSFRELPSALKNVLT